MLSGECPVEDLQVGIPKLDVVAVSQPFERHTDVGGLVEAIRRAHLMREFPST